ncbi:MAG: EAL domain-containing protein, partial [Wenzhouxiangellaceae bacterium]
SLRENLGRFFILLALIGGVLLAWALFDQWRSIIERHEIRQRSQIAALGNATRNVLTNQEVLLELLGRELLLHDGSGEHALEPRRLLDDLRQLNPLVAVYALIDLDGQPTAVNSGIVEGGLPNLRELASTRESFEAALSSDRMVIGRPFLLQALGEWVMPLAKAIRNDEGITAGVMTAGLYLDGDNPFFDPDTFLGPRNNVQVVRGTDLYPLHWASEIPRPEGYFSQPIPRQYYDDAVASAERRSELSIERIKASGRPVSYRVVNALGPHLGMTVYDPVYDFWVLSQTHLNQLRLELLRAGSVHVLVYAMLLMMILVVLQSISRAESARRRELVHRADHDALTGLANRQRMSTDFERMKQEHPDGVSMLFIDLDNFKAFNDGFGHVFGDQLLQRLGRRLRRFVHEDECLARVGGDEFVLISPETDPEALKQRAGQVITTLSKPLALNQVQCELGCSVGIARSLEAGDSLNEVLRAADVAMYSAKHQRNTARLYEPGMGQRYLENIRIEQRLRRALESNAIEMAYQPQFDSQLRLIGMEALARWHDEELGEVEPERFIAVAEASGLIDRLGEYILDLGIDQISELAERLNRPLKLSINVSVRQFTAPGFTQRLLARVDALEQRRLSLAIEITESLFVEDPDAIMAELETLRIAEVGISLDDFGTGYSSLSLLHELPIDELKIDRSFIQHMERDRHARQLVQSIIGIGRSRGMRLMAEGVETERQ